MIPGSGGGSRITPTRSGTFRGLKMVPISNPGAADSRTVATGDYTGDNAASRQITTGFKCSMVIIHKTLHDTSWVIMPSHCLMHVGASAYHDIHDCELHASDGFTVTTTAGPGGYSPNINANTYHYWAISE